MISKFFFRKINFTKLKILLLGIGIIFPINYELGFIFILFFICFEGIFSREYDLFSPFSYFFAWYFYYYGLGYIFYKVRNYIGFNTRFSDTVVFAGIVYSVIVAISIKILIRLFSKKKVINFISVDEYFRKNNLLLLLSFFCLLIFLNAYFFYKIGGIPLFISGYHDSGKATLGIGLGYLEYMVNWINNLIYITLIAFFQKKKKDKISAIIFIISLIFIPILSDSRSSSVFAIINILLLYSWNVKILSFWKIFLTGLIMIIFASCWGLFRGGKDSTRIGIIFISEIGVEYDNYLDCINTFPEDIDFRKGETLISCLTLLLPRKILPNKNDWLTAGEYFKEIKNHDHIRVGERMSLLGEMYMNFSFFFGGIFSVLLISLVLCIARRCYLQKDQNIFLQFFAYYFVIKSKGLIAGDTSTWFSILFYDILFILMLCFFILSAKIKSNKLF